MLGVKIDIMTAGFGKHLDLQPSSWATEIQTNSTLHTLSMLVCTAHIHPLLDTKRQFFLLILVLSSDYSTGSLKPRTLVLELRSTVARSLSSPSRILFAPEMRMGLALYLIW
jgi:hypothetical protein